MEVLVAESYTRNIKDLVNEVLEIAEQFMLRGEGSAKCGKSLLDMLAMAADLCRKEEYDRAQQLCEMASKVDLLGAEYRGGYMDYHFALGIVHYYMAATLIGTEDISRAIGYFQTSSDHFKHLYPITTAAVWLGASELYAYKKEFDMSLWALQRSLNLAEGRPGRSSELLRERIQSEYQVSKTGLHDKIHSEPPRPRSKAKTPAEPNHVLLTFPIFGDLAAGSGMWIPDVFNEEDYAEVEHLRVKGELYRVVNLRNEGKTLRLERSKLYSLARVKGNSMNNINAKMAAPRAIQNGDYVLLCSSIGGYVAQDGDIVAATIQDASGRRGLVKRFRFSRGEAWLYSESTDPSEANISIKDSQAEVFAQVIAVLKQESERN